MRCLKKIFGMNLPSMARYKVPKSRSRGFGFVEMASDESGKKAMEELNEKDVSGRQLVVNEARPRR